jgi:dephospho-CoA kinase
MLVVGLTGGIASGKTMVADILRRAGAVVIDADRMVHRLMAPGGAAWQPVVDAFGQRILLADGTIDRKKLGALIFDNIRRRRELEGIIHPLVRAGIEDEVTRLRIEAPGGLVVQDIPLLLETGMTQGLAEIIVVYVPEAIQLDRLMRRDGISRQAALARIGAQMPMEEKKKRATIVIDNSGAWEETEKQTLEIYYRLAVSR